MKTSRMFSVRLAFTFLITVLIHFSSQAQTSCCDGGFNPQKITLKYTGDDCGSTSCGQHSYYYGCSGNPANDPSVYIIANNSTNPNRGSRWFSGVVALDETFTLDATSCGRTTFSSNTVIHIYSSQGGTLLQRVNFNSTCSQPLTLGDQWGAVTLVSMESDQGVICQEETVNVNSECTRTLSNTTGCSNSNYVLYLVNKYNQSYALSGSAASYQWLERADGSVRIIGTGFTHSSLSGDVFTIDIELGSPTTTPPTGSPKSNNCGSTGSATDWTYYETTSGTITSKLHGVFTVSRRGPAFQQGTNANINQMGYGASGWINISGGDGYFTNGDINAMLSSTCTNRIEECERDAKNTIGCANTPYLLYFKNKYNTAFHLKGDTSKYKWVKYQNGDVRLTATGLQHSSLTNDLYDIDIVFGSPTTSPPSGSPKNSNCGSVGSTNNWIYFQTTFGTIKSSVHGTFIVTRQGPAFQQGMDANITQLGYGASGWLYITGGDGFLSSGDINVMLSQTCDEIVPEVEESCCVTGFKPQKISFQYTGQSCSSTRTVQTSDKYSCSGNPSFDNLVYIISNDNSSATSGNIWFSGWVNIDSIFTIDATSAGATKLSSNTYVHVFNSQGGTKIQTVNFHTSCSQPLNVNDQWGSIKLKGMIAESGASCGTNPPSIETESCCVDGFKPRRITLTYTGEDCSATSTDQSSDKHGCAGNPLSDNMVYIVANNDNSPSSGDEWFSGWVALDSSFTIDATNAGASRLSSNTVIHIYNTQGGSIIQTVNFHTSCSQPLNVNDQWGSIRLDGMISETGASCGTNGTDVEGCERAARNTTSCVGKTFMFYLIDTFNTSYWFSGATSSYKWEEFSNGTVRVSGTGFTNPALSGDMFTVDILLSNASTTPPAGSPKNNYCGALGAMNDWVYYSNLSGTVVSVLHGTFDLEIRGAAFQQGTNANTNQLGYGASGWYSLTGGDGYFDRGDINVMLSETCEVPEVESCCVDGFKPQKITMRYTGESCSATTTTQASDKYSCSGNPLADSEVYIIANDNSDAGSGNIWFEGEVSLDSLFTLSSTNSGETKLSSNTYVHIFNEDGGTEIQTVNFHTSCSQPLNVSDQWGAVRLEGMLSESGATCGTVGGTPPNEEGESCCEDGFRPQKMALIYTGQDCSATNTTQPSDKYSCTGNPNGDQNVYIIANGSSNPSSGYIWFTGTVSLLQTFVLDAASIGQTKLSSNTYLHIYDQQGGTLLQTVNMHTSCSVPLIIGEQWGSMKLKGMESANGAKCGNVNEMGSLNIISGYTFYDLNQNANFGVGEPTISTMIVDLFEDNNCNGVIDSGDDQIGTTTTDSNGYYQFVAPWAGGPFQLEYDITDDTYDGEERFDGSVDLGHGDLHLGERTIGLHYKDINVPPGMTISSAYLEFVSYNDESSSTTVKINAHDVDNSTVLANSSSNFTNRVKTTAEINWTIPAWTSDAKYQSPDIASVVQELLDRSGWNANNDITLLINPYYGAGRRKAYSNERSEIKSPKLIINYDYVGYQECYITKVDVTSEPNNNNLTTDETQTAQFTSGGNIDSMNNFGFFGELPDGYNLIKGTVYGDVAEDAILNTPDVGVYNVGVRLYKDVNCNQSYDAGDQYLRRTESNYEGLYCFAVPFAPISEELVYSINERYDDSEEHSNGDNDLTHDHLHMNERTIAMRYKDLNIPQGATITSAHIEFVSDNDESGSAIVSIYANDVNSSAPLSNSDYYLSNLVTTSNNKNWAPSPWTQNQTYNSPDISNVIQEVINRNGWAANNELTLIIKPVSGSGKRKATSFDDDPSKAPKLHISYSSGNVDCYLTIIDTIWPREYEYLTTDSFNYQVFTNTNQVDDNNDFGLWGDDALPVEMIKFSGIWENNNVKVNWVTASEQNNAFFELQRSFDGITFETITTKPSQAPGGNSNNVLTYWYTDLNVKDKVGKVVYYRVKQVDFDGEYALSNIIILTKQQFSLPKPASISPNPSGGEIQVSLNNQYGGTYDLSVIDVLGKVIYSSTINTNESNYQTNLNLTHLDRGVYYVVIYSNGAVQTEKMVIRRD